MTINKGKTNEELVRQYQARLKARKEKPAPKQEALEERVEGENGLVYSIDDTIYLFREKQDDVEITTRYNTVNALSVHQGKLYDVINMGGLNQTLSGNIIVERAWDTTALCSHNGVLYYGEIDGVYNAQTGEEVVARRGYVNVLCSHDGELYDAGEEGKIYKTLSDEVVAERPTNIQALCSHDGHLFDAGNYGKIIRTHPQGLNELRVADGRICSLCSHNGELLYAGDNKEGIHRIQIKGSWLHKGKIPIKGHVNAMCSVPPEIVQKILEK
ncbi:hypothetical protein GOV06_04165 [Candidatus Woesearchaeota archaeon]|nr:hypothetical protein [Candidatus Woesearchaeota archaeon]